MTPAGAPFRRVLLLVDVDLAHGLRPGTATADVTRADCYAQARFLLDSQPCDTAVVDGRLLDDPARDIAALGERTGSPVVVLSPADAPIVREAIRHGAVWLPDDLARSSPDLVATALDQSDRRARDRRHAERDADLLRESRARNDRLLDLLWQVAPGTARTQWFSQRHMLERLDEELHRVERRGGPLSLVLGDVRPDPGTRPDTSTLHRTAEWLTERVRAGKRKSDVAGQYGLTGFMMILPRGPREEAEGACRRLRRVLADAAHEGLPRMHARFGIAVAPEDAGGLPALLGAAEERLGADQA